METLLAFFESVLIPLLTVLAIPVFLITIAIFIAKMVTRKGSKGGAWMVLLAPIAFYLVVGIIWVVLSVLYGVLFSA